MNTLPPLVSLFLHFVLLSMFFNFLLVQLLQFQALNDLPIVNSPYDACQFRDLKLTITFFTLRSSHVSYFFFFKIHFARIV
jgi:hypothetical protein